MRDVDEDLLKYDRLDVERYADKQEAYGGATSAASAHHSAPVASSWLRLYVQLPNRLAATTIACIFIYEVLVAVSMGVRVLRYVMVNWLMYLLLAVNGGLLLSLGLLVWRAKKDLSLRIMSRFDDASAKARSRLGVIEDDSEL
jgi:hypothetical protein